MRFIYSLMRSLFAGVFVVGLMNGCAKNAQKNNFVSTECKTVCSATECNQVCTTVTGTLKKK
ncbi:hypothetical protein CQA66_08880 [Helicobacter aurati]|uniref:Uncharacterized protein n=1 Tax=Helicobacter aurati TaxID=137778 RepID=A0A3D8IWX9_9HELI|nr:hypothetical protein [Helicobacter aurati]RDU69768.1 hypothetical protein CQA66_08880 [Helicobacter aurati]